MHALGIISFEDSTANIEGLMDFRPAAAIAFMGRYRVIDIILSNMTNSGINNVQVYAKEKPRNLFDHLGKGTHYNINSKRGQLRILFGEKTFSNAIYNTDVANYMLNMQYIEEDSNPYVVIAPSYFVYSFDFKEALDYHKETGSDVTVLYHNTNNAKQEFLNCDTLKLDPDHRVTAFGKNSGSRKANTVSLEAYIMEKKLFIELVQKAAETSSLYWFKDILADSLEELNIRGYSVKGFVGCLNSLSEYYRINMSLRDYDTAKQLFKNDWPMYTKTNDSCPTRFTDDAEISNSIFANGCVIDGFVEGSIISRNVTICKGAEVKDSIILPGAYIGKNAKLDHVVVDKYAIVHHIKKLEGTSENPVYVKRRDRI